MDHLCCDEAQLGQGLGIGGDCHWVMAFMSEVIEIKSRLFPTTIKVHCAVLQKKGRGKLEC